MVVASLDCEWMYDARTRSDSACAALDLLASMCPASRHHEYRGSLPWNYCADSFYVLPLLASAFNVSKLPPNSSILSFGHFL